MELSGTWDPHATGSPPPSSITQNVVFLKWKVLCNSFELILS